MFGKQSRITLMILGLCLLSLLIIGIGFFLWEQQAAKTAVIKNEIEQLMVKKKEIEDKLGPDDVNIKNEGINLEKKRESLKILQKGLMDYQYIPKFLEYVQDAAQETGNELVSISPGEAKPIDFNNPIFKPAPKPAGEGTDTQPPATPASAVPKDPKKLYKSMPITITMKGTYISNIDFINKLRKFKQIIYIRNLTLSPNEVNGQMVVSSIITASALIVPEQYINSTKIRGNKDKTDNPVDKKTEPVKKTDTTVTDKKTNVPGKVPDKVNTPPVKVNTLPVKINTPNVKVNKPISTTDKSAIRKPVSSAPGGTIQ